MKMEVKLIKNISLTENIFCIHRNWQFTRKFIYMQFLMLVYVLYEIAVIVLFVISSIDCYYCEDKTDRLYRFTNNMFSITQIVWAFVRSSAFRKFVENLNICHSQCSHDITYQRRLSKTRNVTMSFCIILGTLLGSILAYNSITNRANIPTINIIIFRLNGMTCCYRFLLEFIVVFCYLSIISHHLAFMVESVDKTTIGDQENVEEQVALFNQWCTLYGDIVKSSKLFIEVFGTQIAFMLVTMASFYILFLYSIFSLSVRGELSAKGLVFYISGTSLMLFELAMMLNRAQQARRNADALRRRLCKHLLLCFDKDSYYRPIKDLLRLVSSRPLEFHTLGLVAVDMTLLPSSFVFFIYNTVIALQFNNVL